MEAARELVDLVLLERVLAVLSLAALLASAGLVIAARLRRSPFPGRAAAAAGAGILLYPLWLVYNRIEDAFGLDSVTALVLNLALFSVIGVAGGLVLRRLDRSDRDAQDIREKGLEQA
jgi:hypothetical protein